MTSEQVTYAEISPSEFFYRNRDLAGFSNPARALYMALRELVENSLDACESFAILPDIRVRISSTEDTPDPKLYVLEVEDNGPGVEPEQVPYAFGRVFYGSKFKLKQSRGMFGLGGTMAILYGQITSNKPVRISTSTEGKVEHQFDMMINIQENAPLILKKSQRDAKHSGLTLKIVLEGDYPRSSAKIMEYFRQTALVSPYAQIAVEDPSGKLTRFERATTSMPQPPKETKPHPYGIDVEAVRRLIRPERRKIIEWPVDVLKQKLEKELHVSIGELHTMSAALAELVNFDGSATDRAVEMKAPRPSKVVGMVDFMNDGGARLASDVKALINDTLARWDGLSRNVRAAFSILAQVKSSLKEVSDLTIDAIDFVQCKVLFGDGGEGESTRPLSPIQPFYGYLLTVAGGDTLEKFMVKNFHRVAEKTAPKFLDFATLDGKRMTRGLSNEELVHLVESMHRYEGFLMPDAECLSPLGEHILNAGISKELQPEFSAVAIRAPSAYSGFPFIVEVGLVYGGKVLSPGLKLFRFANRIPLLYDEASDVSWKVVNEEIDWKRYKIPQEAPIGVITHVCSTKIPYKTVGKEYLADRLELERELKNAVREVLRKLGGYLSRKSSIETVKRRMNIYEKYLPLIANFATQLAGAKKRPDYRKLLRGQAGFEGEVPHEKVEVKDVKRQKTLEDFSN